MIPGSVEESRLDVDTAGAPPRIDRPALFVSTLSPGYVAGGSQCTLAFLQAISHLHGGNVTYLGPPFLKSDPVPEVELAAQIVIDKRSSGSKLTGVARYGSVDRTTPAAVRSLENLAATGTLVYVNGEIAGRVVQRAQSLGLPSVFICHNYAPEYLRAESSPLHVGRRIYAHFASRAALAGYRHADVCVTLTDEDRASYQATSRRERPPQTCLSRCYFGYEDRDGLLGNETPPPPEKFTVLVNTNMAMRQNEEGVLFVLREVWPRIQRQRDWRLILAGRHPTQAIHQAAGRFDSVEVIVRPEPQEMEQIFRRSSVCVAATFKGSGIKLRVAEALRRGLPVVSTEHCSRGYEDISTRVLRTFRSADDMIGSLEHFSKDDAQQLRSACQQEYRTVLSFEAGLQKLSRIADLLPQPQGSR